MRLLHILGLAVLVYLLVFGGLGGYSLKDPDEGRYAEIPREMVESGDYLVPRLNYVRYFEKPPLCYWLVAASYRIFGINEGTFRLPNAIAALMSAVLLYLWARRRFEKGMALRASLILLTSLGFIAMTRIVTLDMTFSLFLMLALLAFHSFYYEGRSRWLYLFWGSAALATMVKGPAAIVLLGTTVFIFLLLERNLRFLTKLFWSPAFLAYFAIAAPWFIAISLREAEFPRFFFVDQHFLRFLTTKHARSGPLYYFIPVLLLGMLPWSFLIPQAVAGALRHSPLRLFLIWICVVFFFFSVSGSKLPPYILPLFPAMALLMGHYLVSVAPLGRERPGVTGVVYAFFFLFLAALFFSLAAGLFDARLARTHEEFFASPASLRLSSLLPAVSCLILAVILFIRRRAPATVIVAANAVLTASLIVLFLMNLGLVDPYKTAKPLAAAIAAARPAPDHIMDLNSFHESLPFYLRRPITIVAYFGELEMGSRYPDARGRFLSLDDFIHFFRSSPDRVFAVVKKTKRERFAKISAAPMTVVSCHGDDCIITNR